MDILLASLIFVFGTIFGSFANMLIHRLPNNLSLGGRSACPHCQQILGFWELWPIVSFLCLQGKCKHCKHKISLRYLLVEIIMGFLFLGAWAWVLPTTLLEFLFLIKLVCLSFFALIVFVIDYEHFLIMDALVLVFGLIFFVLNLTTDLYIGQGFKSTLAGFWGALGGSLPFYLIWFFSKGRLMGFGDVKLMLTLGLVLGFPIILVGVFIAVMLGGILGASLLLTGKAGLKTALPFGCFLSSGAIIALIYGEQLLSWYLSIIAV